MSNEEYKKYIIEYVTNIDCNAELELVYEIIKRLLEGRNER